MQFGFSLDPCVILGVGEGASLQEIRDAYRARAKRHHPDHGGDEWVFRVVCQAYELLSQARLAGRLSAEAPAPAAAEAPRVAPIRPPTAGEAGPRAETARHGFRDDVADPSRLVDVEKFVIRYAISDPLQALLATAEDRTLSSSLNLAWPATEAGGAEVSPDPDVLDRVVGAFTPLVRKTRASGSHVSTEDGRFRAWLAYPGAARGEAALEVVHKAFRAAGLGISLRTREMLIPRDGG